jgi:DNA-binding CsgD family transcriptional regulator
VGELLGEDAEADDDGLRAAIGLVEDSDLAAVVLEIPSERILGTSASALRLLDPHAESVVGRNLEDFTADEPSGGLELVADGRIHGYETTRLIRGPERVEPLQVWISAVDRPGHHGINKYVLAVVAPEGTRPSLSLPLVGTGPYAPVVGSADRDLVVDRISSDVHDLLGLRPDEIIGHSLFRLFDSGDVSTLMWALAQTNSAGGGTIRVRLHSHDGLHRPMHLFVLPLSPPPSCTFALIPESTDSADAGDGQIEAELLALRCGMGAVGLSHEVSSWMRTDVAGFETLSSRELEIARCLLAGDRVPAIARALFLSPSTVRNHLSGIFRKLGVSSQQELIDLLRLNSGRKPTS